MAAQCCNDKSQMKLQLIKNKGKQQSVDNIFPFDLLQYFHQNLYKSMMNMNELYLQVKGKWKSLYPIYFDSTKTISQGRRLSKQLCIESPTLQQLAKAVCFCQLRNIIEPHKAYSRDYFQVGRLKIELCQENGKPVHEHIPSKKVMMVKVAQKLRLLRQK